MQPWIGSASLTGLFPLSLTPMPWDFTPIKLVAQAVCSGSALLEAHAETPIAESPGRGDVGVKGFSQDLVSSMFCLD